MKKCWCLEPPYAMTCGGCNRVQGMFTELEIENIQNAISFFIKKYPAKGSLKTKKEMNALLKKTWKILKKARDSE